MNRTWYTAFFNKTCTGIFELMKPLIQQNPTTVTLRFIGAVRTSQQFVITLFRGKICTSCPHPTGSLHQLTHSHILFDHVSSDLIWHFFPPPVWAFYHRRLEIRTTAKHAWPWQSSGQRTSVPAFRGFLWLRSMPDTVLDWHDSALLGTDNILLGGSSPCHATDPVPTWL